MSPPSNRRVLITGAGRGIGRAIALELAAQGYTLALNYRADHQAAEATLAEVLQTGAQASLLPFDIAEREQAAAALEQSIAQAGAFWGIVCNAGVTDDAPLPGMSPEAWDRVIRTNLDGFYNVLRPCMLPMIQLRDGGRVVTLASTAGQTGNRGQVNYSASKAGIIGATKALALELASRAITANCVAPGFIATEMIEQVPPEHIKNTVPMQRPGTPEEVAATVGFLFQEKAGYLTGQVIGVNGGLA